LSASFSGSPAVAMSAVLSRGTTGGASNDAMRQCSSLLVIGISL
jgi:hypothetical protein